MERKYVSFAFLLKFRLIIGERKDGRARYWVRRQGTINIIFNL